VKEDSVKRQFGSGTFLVGLALFSAVAQTSGCGILDLEGDVEVRVRNGSSHNLDEVSLFLPRGTLSYSDLQPGEETSYSQVSKAYDYASAEVVIGQDTARIQVIDYVGETPLGGGRYTYIVRVFEGQPFSIGLDFEKDS
jgi:hypothetical protein